LEGLQDGWDESLVERLRKVYGGMVWRVIDALRTPGSRYYVRINTLKTSRGEILDRLRSRGIDVRADETLGEAAYFPIKGPYKVPQAGRRVVADKKAAESVLMGADLYAPGVLRAPRGLRRGEEVNVVSEKGHVVALGEAAMSGGEMMEAGRGLAVKTLISRYKAPKIRELPEYSEGLIYSQSLPAMLASRILDPRPGEIIVDMCAAPGGKATHIAQLAGNKAEIHAFDHSKRKVEAMRLEARRLGARITVHRADSRYLHIDYQWLKADKVILDPPCTALGVRPKLWEDRRAEDIDLAARYQAQFIEPAYRILKPGGILVYSTCTMSLEEDELMAERIMERGFQPLEPYPRRGSPGVWGRRDMYIRFHPHLHSAPGYFIAVFRKT